MNKRNILKLSMLYYKSNRKSFSSFIFAMVFSLSILFIIAFLLLGCTIGLNKTLNSYPSVSVINVQFNDDLEKEIKNEICNLKNIDDERHFIDYTFAYLRKKEGTSFSSPMITYYPSLFIDQKEYYFDYEPTKNTKISELYSVMESGYSLITKQEYSYVNSLNEDFVFLGDSFSNLANEIILNSSLLEYLNISIDDALGSTFTYVLPQKGSDGTIENVVLLENYKIIGVFNDRLYNCPSRFSSEIDAPLFWVSNYSQENINDKVESYATQNLTIQFQDFSSCITNLDILENSKKKYENVNYLHINRTNLVNDYYEIFPILKIISLISIILSGCIIVLCILNMINNVIHTAKQRKSFNAMCNAMGMTFKESMLVNLYELFIIFLKILIYILLVTFSICLFLTILINFITGNSDNSYLIHIKIDFSSYPILVGSMIIFLLTIFGIVFIPVYRIKNTDIITYLNKNL